MLESLNDAVNKGKEKAKGEKADLERKLSELGIEVPLVDVEIKFIGASGLPKMDVVGLADPYFVAKLDDKITFVYVLSSPQLQRNPQPPIPVWNEVWRVRNVPATTSLKVEIMDKDEGSATDDFIGKFSVSLTPGAKEVEIEGPIIALRKARGTFWLKIDSKPSEMRQKHDFHYLFDGPIRVTRHFSPTVGLLTSGSAAKTPSHQGAPGEGRPKRDVRLYSTWKFNLKSVPLFFRDVYQGWNQKYPAAQKIFGGGASSLAVRAGIQAGHRMLYARLASNGVGVIDNIAEDGSEEPVPLKDVLNAGSVAPPSHADNSPFAGMRRDASHNSRNSGEQDRDLATSLAGEDGRIKPAVYTYIISAVDDTWRFSETGAAFFVDFASKHALHANCATKVRYSGEFHPRPVGGWAKFNDSISDDDVDWELVIDNNSGTYAPDKMMLPTVQECMEYNFGCRTKPRSHKGERAFRVVVFDREDKRLTESVEACRNYAVNVRGVRQEDLQPHVDDGEVTLEGAASPKAQEEFRDLPAPPLGPMQMPTPQVAGRDLQDTYHPMPPISMPTPYGRGH
ncbi:hypothetical protein NMY22_g10978 [Coprinellus aureogranulatus]|nr:hypothetical protein NMY22_g10978 [Coprinellus aureogranulatus]